MLFLPFFFPAGFDLKGGDATQGKLFTQYSGPRPNRTIAGTCGGGGSAQSKQVVMEKCTPDNAGQEWVSKNV